VPARRDLLTVVLDLHAFADRLLSALDRDPRTPVDDELVLDSLEVYQFQVVLEELCGQELPLDLLEQVTTVRAAYEWYQVKA
jgi:acyl carrier protein